MLRGARALISIAERGERGGEREREKGGERTRPTPLGATWGLAAF